MGFPGFAAMPEVKLSMALLRSSTFGAVSSSSTVGRLSTASRVTQCPVYIKDWKVFHPSLPLLTPVCDYFPSAGVKVRIVKHQQGYS